MGYINNNNNNTSIITPCQYNNTYREYSPFSAVCVICQNEFLFRACVLCCNLI